MNISLKKALLIALAGIGSVSLAAFLAILLFVAVKKPFGIKVQNVPGALIKATTNTPSSTYNHPLLSTEQESTLESLGVDTKSLPTSITAAQLACFTAKLGPARVQEIENGSAIGPSDYLKARSCIR